MTQPRTTTATGGIWAFTQRGYSGVLHLVDTTDPKIRQTVCKPHRLTGPGRDDAQAQRDVIDGVNVCKRCMKAGRKPAVVAE